MRCNKRISLLYPLVEIVTGTLTAGLLIEQGISWEAVMKLLFIYAMIAVVVIDWQYLVIPDEILLSLIIVGISYFLFIKPNEIVAALISGIVSGGSFLCIKFIADRYFKKQTLGMGDIKLAGVLGLFLGWEIFLVVVWIASVFGSLFGIAQLYFLGKSRDTKLPFGTFLAVVSSGTMIFKNDIEQVILEWITYTQ